MSLLQSFKRIFQTKTAESAFDAAVFNLTRSISPDIDFDRDLVVHTRGPASEFLKRPFERHIRILLDLDMITSRAFPLITQVRSGKPTYSIRWTMNFLQDVLAHSAEYYKLHQDPERVRTLYFDLVRSRTEPPLGEFARAVFDHEWKSATSLASGAAVSFIQKLVRHLEKAWYLAVFGFEKVTGGITLVDGFELNLKECKGRSIESFPIPIKKQLEEAAASLLAEESSKFLSVHCLSTSNPRFPWMAVLQHFDVLDPVLTWPMLWNPKTTSFLTDAFCRICGPSAQFRSEVDGEIRLDGQKGEMMFGRIRRPVKLIASFRDKDFTWLWEFGRTKDQAPASVLNICSKVSSEFPRELLQTGAVIRPAFWDFLIVPSAVAIGAGYPLVYSTDSDDQGINYYYAVK